MSDAPFNFCGLPEEHSSFQTSRIVVLPIPFERTTTYARGTRNGPRHIIDASRNVELYEEDTETEAYKLGIHTLAELNTDDLETIQECMDRIYESVRRLLEEGKFVVSLGGEHSITFPIVRAYKEKYPDLSVLQIDAQADLRSSYAGTIYSHASVMRRVVDICPIVQVGIRSLSRQEADEIPSLRTKIFWARDIARSQDWINEVYKFLSEHVYITIDVDGFDPSLIPSTGTPEPGGLDWHQTLACLRRVAQERNVVGFDVVELMPIAGLHAPDFVVARLVYKLLNYIFETELKR